MNRGIALFMPFAVRRCMYPPAYDGVMRRMAVSLTGRSNARDAANVTNTAEAVAQVFAGGDPANLFEAYFAQKLCHRQRGTLELDRKRRWVALGGAIKADIPPD